MLVVNKLLYHGREKMKISRKHSRNSAIIGNTCNVVGFGTNDLMGL